MLKLSHFCLFSVLNLSLLLQQIFKRKKKSVLVDRKNLDYQLQDNEIVWEDSPKIGHVSNSSSTFVASMLHWENQRVWGGDRQADAKISCLSEYMLSNLLLVPQRSCKKKWMVCLHCFSIWEGKTRGKAVKILTVENIIFFTSFIQLFSRKSKVLQ